MKRTLSAYKCYAVSHERVNCTNNSCKYCVPRQIWLAHVKIIQKKAKSKEDSSDHDCSRSVDQVKGHKRKKIQSKRRSPITYEKDSNSEDSTESTEEQLRDKTDDKKQNTDSDDESTNKHGRDQVDGGKKRHKRKEIQSKRTSSSIFEKIRMLCVLIAAVVIPAVLSCYKPNEGQLDYCNPHKRDNCSDFLRQQVSNLSKKYNDQSREVWRVLISAAATHVEYQPRPERPIVIMTYNFRKGPSEDDSIYRDVSDIYESVLSPNKKRGFFSINGAEFEGVDPDDVQRKILTTFEDEYRQEGKRVAVIHNFDSLPSCSVLTFHNLCNNADAPYKDMAIILSVKGDKEPEADMKGKELEGIIANKFHKEWKDCPEYLPKDKIDAMLSRIANNVVVLK
ncbi:putative torsin-1A-interacting protein 1-like [Apostichopus japonicus]|uniref:Putative torsin-1A-interacting protein 1-like n=1 Tax=Stichopus japonicus TaxID=307972 RepID=A0A2G8LP42_STIJA|nr:putative torsin-1A-interacting protein 1-like [Apostichopus japonicus]